jgi:hypothetical protein
LLKESCIIHGNQSTSNMSWDIPHFILIIIIKSTTVIAHAKTMTTHEF